MTFSDFIKGIFSPVIQTETGYILDEAEYIQSLPKSEYFGASPGLTSHDWSPYMPTFRWQEATMMCTAFAGTSAISALTKWGTVYDELYSPLELFVRTNGEIYGNTIANLERGMKAGVTAESDSPWVGPVDSWTPFILKLTTAYGKATSKPVASRGIKGLTFISPDPVSMRRGLITSPLLAIVHVGRGYFDTVAPKVDTGFLHAMVITHIEADGRIKVFDSLTRSQGFDGFHYLAPDFNILYAYGILDLPNGWQAEQEKLEQAKLPDRYGRPRSLTLEAKIKTDLLYARSRNPTHAAYIDKDFTLYLMAVVYGGYSVQDVLNHITSIRRLGWPIFDFNKPKV